MQWSNAAPLRCKKPVVNSRINYHPKLFSRNSAINNILSIPRYSRKQIWVAGRSNLVVWITVYPWVIVILYYLVVWITLKTLVVWVHYPFDLIGKFRPKPMREFHGLIGSWRKETHRYFQGWDRWVMVIRQDIYLFMLCQLSSYAYVYVYIHIMCTIKIMLHDDMMMYEVLVLFSS